MLFEECSRENRSMERADSRYHRYFRNLIRASLTKERAGHVPDTEVPRGRLALGRYAWHSATHTSVGHDAVLPGPRSDVPMLSKQRRRYEAQLQKSFQEALGR